MSKQELRKVLYQNLQSTAVSIVNYDLNNMLQWMKFLSEIFLLLQLDIDKKMFSRVGNIIMDTMCNLDKEDGSDRVIALLRLPEVTKWLEDNGEPCHNINGIDLGNINDMIEVGCLKVKLHNKYNRTDVKEALSCFAKSYHNTQLKIIISIVYINWYNVIYLYERSLEDSDYFNNLMTRDSYDNKVSSKDIEYASKLVSLSTSEKSEYDRWLRQVINEDCDLDFIATLTSKVDDKNLKVISPMLKAELRLFVWNNGDINDIIKLYNEYKEEHKDV